MRLLPLILALALIGCVASMLAPPSSTIVEVLFSPYTSPYNNGWNGTSVLVERLRQEGYHVDVLDCWDNLEGYQHPVLLIVIAPELAFSGEDLKTLRSFMERERLILLVADESTTSNSMLKPLVNASIAGWQLVTRLPDGRLSYAQNVTWELGGVEYHVVLNRPSAITSLGLLKPVFTSDSSVETLVLRENGSLSEAGSASFTIGGEALIGDDRIFVLSDSSLFINQCWRSAEFRDDSRFAIALMEYLVNGSKEYAIVFDASHYVSEGRALTLLEVSVPLPPLGLVLGLLASSALRLAELAVREAFTYPLTALIASMLLTLAVYVVIMPRGVREWTSLRLEPPPQPPSRPRVSWVLRRVMAGEDSLKRAMCYAVASLYEAVDSMLARCMGVTASAVISGSEEGELARYRPLLEDMRRLWVCYRLRKTPRMSLRKLSEVLNGALNLYEELRRGARGGLREGLERD